VGNRSKARSDQRPWHQKSAAERDSHDWLYAAAAALIRRGEEEYGENRPAFFEASRIVMDFADRNCDRGN
jgi:hypothetical protein